jgi:hypothetical protein
VETIILTEARLSIYILEIRGMKESTAIVLIDHCMEAQEISRLIVLVEIRLLDDISILINLILEPSPSVGPLNQVARLIMV